MQSTADNEANRAKEAFYQKALQDLILFKSKTNAALLQVCLCNIIACMKTPHTCLPVAETLVCYKASSSACDIRHHAWVAGFLCSPSLGWDNFKLSLVFLNTTFDTRLHTGGREGGEV